MIKKINYVFNRKQKMHLFILYIVILLGTAAELIGLAGILSFITVLMEPQKFLGNQYVQKIYIALHFQSENQFIIFIALVLMLIYVLKNAFLLLMNNLQYRFILHNQHRLSKRMLEAYIYEPYLFHTAHNSAELRTNIASDVDTFFVVVLNILQLLTEVTVCIILLSVMLVADKSITIGVIVLMGAFLLVFAKMYKKKVSYYGKERRKYMIKMNKWLDQSLGGIKEIKILNREKFFVEKYAKTNLDYVENRRKYTFFSVTPKPMIETVCIVAVLMIISLKLARGVAPEYFIRTLYIFALAAYRMIPSASKIASYLSNITFNKVAVDSLYADLKEIEERKFAQKEKGVQLEQECKEITFKKEITIKNLSFRYPNVEQYVLKDINFKIPQNKSVAFIGPSGAGKTTLADIILGVLTPEKGSVYVDGVNVFENLKSWHQKLSYIPQNIYLMDDTIRNNIAFGIDEQNIDEGKVWKALEGAQLADFVRGLERGLDTTIGERGVRFSGGQRQRIGIARALYYNSEILVLDEATSALDNETEKAVMEAINNLSGKKTLIIIAHRLTTIQNCDIIYEVKEGRVSIKDNVIA